MMPAPIHWFFAQTRSLALELTYFALNKYDHIRFRHALRQFKPVDYLMDIGSGNNPQTFIKVNKRHYTVDPVPQDNGDKYWHINGTWEHPAMNFMKNNQIDCVVLMDVIEHLDRKEAMGLLYETEKLVKQIIVFTPLGFMEQNDTENPWNTHRSGWTPEDFGDGWTIQIFPHFHWCDFKGRVYPKPWPAMLAVYNGVGSCCDTCKHNPDTCGHCWTDCQSAAGEV